MPMRRRITGWTVGIAAAAAMLGAAGTMPFAAVASAASAGVSACSSPSGAVSCTPASGTPALAVGGGLPTQQVRQLVQCGSMMYAVGNFTTLTYNGQTVHRTNAFSFQASAPYAISNWRPHPNGPVNSIALTGDCSTAFLGGKFTTVRGASARNIVAVKTSTGALRTAFRHSANGEVDTVVRHADHLLTGGTFTQINGSSHDYYVSLNTTTGENDRYINLHISGNYRYSGATENPTRVFNQQMSSAYTKLLAEGDFTSVGGQHREQIFMLSLGSRKASLTAWNATQFYGHCGTSEPFYARAAAWSPSGSTIYTATTGNKPLGSHSPGGLCDTAAAFPATYASVHSQWINYTGCDSLYSTAAGKGIAYFGGHERWADNPDGCNSAGSGAIAAQGMVGLSQNGGSVVFNPGRARGYGADDMLLTNSGLWVASDTYGGAQNCAYQPGHGGICFFRY